MSPPSPVELRAPSAQRIEFQRADSTVVIVHGLFDDVRNELLVSNMDAKVGDQFRPLEGPGYDTIYRIVDVQKAVALSSVMRCRAIPVTAEA